MLFKCTKKVRTELGLADRDLAVEPTASEGKFNEWYCNLFYLDRHKCLIVTEAATLFSFVVPGIRRYEIRDFGLFFRSHTVAALLAHGFTKAEAARVITYGPDRYAKPDSRAVLGSMNDLVRMCRFYVESRGDFKSIDFSQISRELNDTPMSYIGMQYPSKYLKHLLDSRGAE